MKILKKIIAGLVVAAMVAALLPAGMIPIRASAAEGNPLRMWYDEPASQGTNILSAGSGYSNADGSNTWQQQTLPIGNGDMGANVYGEIVSEHLTFNEKTLWTGGPSASRPDYKGGNLESKGQNGAIMRQIQELFLEGMTKGFELIQIPLLIFIKLAGVKARAKIYFGVLFTERFGDIRGIEVEPRANHTRHAVGFGLGDYLVHAAERFVFVTR